MSWRCDARNQTSALWDSSELDVIGTDMVCFGSRTGLRRRNSLECWAMRRLCTSSSSRMRNQRESEGGRKRSSDVYLGAGRGDNGEERGFRVDCEDA
eukprot:974438-Rhodomonas_salina.1